MAVSTHIVMAETGAAVLYCPLSAYTGIPARDAIEQACASTVRRVSNKPSLRFGVLCVPMTKDQKDRGMEPSRGSGERATAMMTIEST